MSLSILFHFVCYHFPTQIERCHLKYFSILRPVQNNVRFEYAHWKMSDFVSFSLFGFTLNVKLKNFDFESH